MTQDNTNPPSAPIQNVLLEYAAAKGRSRRCLSTISIASTIFSTLIFTSMILFDVNDIGINVLGVAGSIFFYVSVIYAIAALIREKPKWLAAFSLALTVALILLLAFLSSNFR